MSGLREKIENGSARVAIVGFGYIGTCIGAVLADKGLKVIGIDVRKDHVDEINRGTTSIAEPGLPELIRKTVQAGNLHATTEYSALGDCDVVVVTVGTPLGKNFDPDTRDIITASRAMAEFAHPGQLFILKSTVPPGTTEEIVFPELSKRIPKEKLYLSFCPERLAEGKAISELQTIPVVVGGINQVSTQMSELFWQSSLGIKTIAVDSCKAAEIVKLACNLWIDLNIAVANEIALLCEQYGADALQVNAAANTLPKGNGYVNILFPSLGVGGYCLTKDPWFVHHIGKQRGLDLLTPVASRRANDRMPEHTFHLIKKILEKAGKNLQSSKVAVLGISFKNNTGDCRYTPTKPVIDLLEKSGCQLEICDPWVHAPEAKSVTSRPLNPDMLATLKGADLVAFFTGHDEFKAVTVGKLKELLKTGAGILDGRNFFSREKIAEARAAGFIYQGIGR